VNRNAAGAEKTRDLIAQAIVIGDPRTCVDYDFNRRRCFFDVGFRSSSLLRIEWQHHKLTQASCNYVLVNHRHNSNRKLLPSCRMVLIPKVQNIQSGKV